MMMLAIKANTKNGKQNKKGDFKKMVGALLTSEKKESFYKHKFALDVSLLALTIGCSDSQVRRATEDYRSSLSADMDTYVLDRKEEGASNREIAKEIGCSEFKVRSTITECDKTASCQNNAPSDSSIKDQDLPEASTSGLNVEPTQLPTIQESTSEADEDFGGEGLPWDDTQESWLIKQ